MKTPQNIDTTAILTPEQRESAALELKTTANIDKQKEILKKLEDSIRVMYALQDEAKKQEIKKSKHQQLFHKKGTMVLAGGLILTGFALLLGLDKSVNNGKITQYIFESVTNTINLKSIKNFLPSENYLPSLPNISKLSLKHKI